MTKHRTHRIQATGRPGVPGWRVAPRARQEPQHQPQPDQDLGRQVRGWGARQRHGRRRLLADYEARIAALERLVGKLALENEFLKGASRHCRQPRSASTSVVAGRVVSQSQKDAG